MSPLPFDGVWLGYRDERADLIRGIEVLIFFADLDLRCDLATNELLRVLYERSNRAGEPDSFNE